MYESYKVVATRKDDGETLTVYCGLFLIGQYGKDSRITLFQIGRPNQTLYFEAFSSIQIWKEEKLICECRNET